MSAKFNTRYLIDVILFATCIGLTFGTFQVASAYPSANVNLLSPSNKLESSKSLADETAEQSFHQFINSKPDSTIIGEFKPNASALELMLLRNKIANTILNMQEMDKATVGLAPVESSTAECYIEVTRVEKVPGKCHRSSSRIPICQSENYMAISNECN